MDDDREPLGTLAGGAGRSGGDPVDGLDDGHVALTEAEAAAAAPEPAPYDEPDALADRGSAEDDETAALDPGSVPAADPGSAPAAEQGFAHDDEAEAASPAAATPVARTSVARLVAQRLAGSGVRYAFGVPGEGSLSLPEELLDAGVRVVATRHEGAASFMAAAAAQVTGRPQVLFASRTPGAANAAIGIHAARQDSLPVVALISGVRREHRGREAFQESDLASGIGSLARWSVELERPGDAARVLGEGQRQLLGGRPGPIALVLPEDLLGNEVAADGAHPPAPSSGPIPDRDAVSQAVKWLAASRRGVILAGGGVTRARASKRLLALADELGVPVIASWRRPDVVPNDHPGYLGMAGTWGAQTVRPRLEEADVLLVIGARLDQVTTHGYRIPSPSTRFIHVDLEPRTATRGLRAPDLAIASDAARFLDLAWADLRGKVLDAENRSWRLERLAEDRDAFLAASDVSGGEWTGPGVHPGRVIGALQAALPSNAIIATDAGNAAGWLARGYRFLRPGTFLGTTSGSMGYAIPAAIAASLVHGDRPVVAVCGDGGFAMSMAELETAVREGARPIVVVLDDQGYGTVRMHQDRHGRAHVASELGSIDAVAVAEACGAVGFRAADDAAFEAALVEALASRRTAVIHCPIDRAWVSVDRHP
ncbi:MAG: thiamine pyrophosphate-binding protein [Candidatus Limnocylindrales bacterium]